MEHVNMSLRLSPRGVVGKTLFVFGALHFVSRRLDEAVPKLILAIQQDPDYPAPYRFLAACYAHMGRLGEARNVVERLRDITQAVFPPDPQFRNLEHRELFLSGLRAAAGNPLELLRPPRG
jgi:tetratricopeptide (TPR) repeat protein